MSLHYLQLPLEEAAHSSTLQAVVNVHFPLNNLTPSFKSAYLKDKKLIWLSGFLNYTKAQKYLFC